MSCQRVTSRPIKVSIGSPEVLWTPVGFGESMRYLLPVDLIACACLALATGPCTSLEVYKVRSHKRSDAIINPISGILGAWAGIGFVACVVLVIRHMCLCASLAECGGRSPLVACNPSHISRWGSHTV